MRYRVVHMQNVKLILLLHIGDLNSESEGIVWISEKIVLVDLDFMKKYVFLIKAEFKGYCVGDEMHFVPFFSKLMPKFCCQNPAAAN